MTFLGFSDRLSVQRIFSQTRIATFRRHVVSCRMIYTYGDWVMHFHITVYHLQLQALRSYVAVIL
jgi:hypothetical protein